ncbi:class I SAM-dependent methyltransferase [Celeribacter arenosi]|uniref:Methyltransferase domain-containing protein n=1 Tax=Celeribacter arenosi TaxID=792649 RepID=A0ABP7KB55_9RHOB
MSSPFFWKLLHKRYVASPVADEAIYQRKLRETQARLQPSWDILEIGCGSGNTALNHAPFVNSVTACDFCDPMMDHGRARAASEGITNVTFKEARLEDIAMDRDYDAVLMLSLIHLIPDWKNAIAKAAALTKQGGIFVSSTATLGNAAGPMKWIAPIFRFLPIVPTLAVFSRSDLLEEIIANGFTLEESWTNGDNDEISFVIARKTG